MSDDYKDWTVTLPFAVQPGDFEGAMTEAIFEAARRHAPAEAAGMVASADTVEGKVWITFTLENTSRGLADDIAAQMRQRVRETVLSEEDACVTAT
jgi:succinylarginine dihydrolase